MDAGLELVAWRSIFADTVLETVSEASLPCEIRDALALVRDEPHAVSAIMWDANTLYIRCGPNAVGLDGCFRGRSRHQSGAHRPFDLELVLSHDRRLVPRRLGTSSACLHRVSSEHVQGRFGPRACYAISSGAICLRRRRCQSPLPIQETRREWDCAAAGRVALARKLATTKVNARVQPWTTPSELLESIRTVLPEKTCT
jgi:hypothetical protein